MSPFLKEKKKENMMFDASSLTTDLSEYSLSGMRMIAGYSWDPAGSGLTAVPLGEQVTLNGS